MSITFGTPHRAPFPFGKPNPSPLGNQTIPYTGGAPPPQTPLKSLREVGKVLFGKVLIGKVLFDKVSFGKLLFGLRLIGTILFGSILFGIMLFCII